MQMLRALLAATLLAVMPVSSMAEPPPRPDTWVALTPVMPCTVDTEPDRGFCRLFMDTDDDTRYVVFFDQPRRVKFIRSGTDGDYNYLYLREPQPTGFEL